MLRLVRALIYLDSRDFSEVLVGLCTLDVQVDVLVSFDRDYQIRMLSTEHDIFVQILHRPLSRARLVSYTFLLFPSIFLRKLLQLVLILFILPVRQDELLDLSVKLESQRLQLLISILHLFDLFHLHLFHCLSEFSLHCVLALLGSRLILSDSLLCLSCPLELLLPQSLLLLILCPLLDLLC